MNFEIRNGSFCYSNNKQVLQNINFCIDKPEILSVLGANGSGKTTMLKCMLGLLPWSNGGTYIDGKNIKEMKYQDLWQKIGYVPQAKAAAFAYSVEDMVLLGRNSRLGTFGQPGEKDRAIVDHCLEQIGIAYLKGKLCSQISGGELQMVLIARALAAEPTLLVLDEPESNLDFKNQLIVLNTIQKLCEQQHISAIINTHYPDHAIAISQKSLLLNYDGNNLFGETSEIITENNMRKTFDVDVKIRDMKLKERTYTCVIPISILNL